MAEKQAYTKQTPRGGEGVAPHVESPHENDDEKTPCEPGENNRKSDLCAQWKAADAAAESAGWARWSFWLAIASFAASLFTLVAAIFAAKGAWDAARHTEAGSKEAKPGADAALSSHGLNEQLERPLFDVEMPKKQFKFVHDRFAAEEIYFKIVNTGRSPGRITSIRRCWEATSGQNVYPGAISPTEPQKGFEKKCPRYVGAGMETEGIWSRYQDILIIPSEMKPERVFFHRFIRYQDLTGKRFISGFCYSVDVTERGEGRFRFAWPARDPERYHYHYEDERTENAADEA